MHEVQVGDDHQGTLRVASGALAVFLLIEQSEAEGVKVFLGTHSLQSQRRMVSDLEGVVDRAFTLLQRVGLREGEASDVLGFLSLLVLWRVGGFHDLALLCVEFKEADALKPGVGKGRRGQAELV